MAFRSQSKHWLLPSILWSLLRIQLTFALNKEILGRLSATFAEFTAPSPPKYTTRFSRRSYEKIHLNPKLATTPFGLVFLILTKGVPLGCAYWLLFSIRLLATVLWISSQHLFLMGSQEWVASQSLIRNNKIFWSASLDYLAPLSHFGVWLISQDEVSLWAATS